MKLRLSLISALLASMGFVACGTPGQSSEASPPDAAEAGRIGYPTVEAALAALRARPGISESTSDGWTVIEDKARRETWLFSPAGHAAHPAVVKRTSVKRLGETHVQTAAMCGASQAECDKLVAQIEAADRKGAEAAGQTGQPAIPGGSRGGMRY